MMNQEDAGFPDAGIQKLKNISATIHFLVL
jgi:hypothetical protein